MTRPLAALLTLLLGSPAALACGAFFPGAPDLLAIDGERILFAREGEQMHMIARLTWAGEPADFGWLLPVPRDAQLSLSSEELFQWLEARFAARFAVRNDYDESCADWLSSFDAGIGGGAFDGGVDGRSGVQVLAQEAVGPFESVLLAAEQAQELITWLEGHGYHAPAGIGERLQPYLDLGLGVMALRLSAGADSNDVVPVQLTYTGDVAAIPLRPTGASAVADTALSVHLLGPSRAVPVEPFKHVVINDRLIDWAGGGENYAAVVASAADEAGGHAFATDFAGAVGAYPFRPLPAAQVDEMAAATTLAELEAAYFLPEAGADLQRILRAVITPPDGADIEAIFDCFECYPQAAVDGEALGRALRTEFNPARETLVRVFAQHPYLTRLTTALSPAELDRDAVFAFNPDLADVEALRQATRRVSCPDGRPDEGGAVTLPVGGRWPGTALRREGENRADPSAMPAARRVEWMMAAGQPEVIADNGDAIDAHGAGGA
ncbi:MAG: DUF2330 domain-containing protein, partial [Myxococcales bacterium]|nr:DUF2330 domain-containing protein [Myxococcales bacterium]